MLDGHWRSFRNCIKSIRIMMPTGCWYCFGWTDAYMYVTAARTVTQFRAQSVIYMALTQELYKAVFFIHTAWRAIDMVNT